MKDPLPAPRGPGSALLALFVCALTLLPGCADMQLTRTGFLDHYEQLQPAPEREVFGIPDQVLAYEKPGVDWSRYRRVFIDEVVFRPVAEPHAEVSADEARELESDFREILEEELAVRFELARGPGPGTVTVRAAITDVEDETPWLNWVMVVLLMPTSMGGISGEIEVLDSDSGERLLALSATREGTPFLILECFDRFGHAEHGMLKWARALVDTAGEAPTP